MYIGRVHGKMNMFCVSYVWSKDENFLDGWCLGVGGCIWVYTYIEGDSEHCLIYIIYWLV